VPAAALRMPAVVPPEDRRIHENCSRSCSVQRHGTTILAVMLLLMVGCDTAERNEHARLLAA
jgi:hypothetical protein